MEIRTITYTEGKYKQETNISGDIQAQYLLEPEFQCSIRSFLFLNTRAGKVTNKPREQLVATAPLGHELHKGALSHAIRFTSTIVSGFEFMTTQREGAHLSLLPTRLPALGGSIISTLTLLISGLSDIYQTFKLFNVL